MTNSNNISHAIEDFADIARRYCAWAEGKFADPHEEMRRAREFLAQLHLAAVQLPELKAGDDIDHVSMSHEDWSVIFNKFATLPVTSYFDVFNPLNETEAIESNLADDLADIYRDVTAGLHLFDSHHPVDAAWEWRLGFQTHWGHHLVGAQRAIHEFLAEDGL